MHNTIPLPNTLSLILPLMLSTSIHFATFLNSKAVLNYLRSRDNEEAMGASSSDSSSSLADYGSAYIPLKPIATYTGKITVVTILQQQQQQQ